MGFAPVDFIRGVIREQTPIIKETVRRLNRGVELSLEEAAQRARAEREERLFQEKTKIDVLRAGGLPVNDVLYLEPTIVSEYLEVPSVLQIRKGTTLLAATDNFILSSINETDQERMSFTHTFGDPVIFGGMGRRPRVFSYSGFLKDSIAGGKGISGWRVMYDKYLRATRCRRSGALADLRDSVCTRPGRRLGRLAGHRAVCLPGGVSPSFYRGIIEGIGPTAGGSRGLSGRSPRTRADRTVPFS